MNFKQDFINVLGSDLFTIISRLCKSVLAHKNMMLGSDIATAKLPIRLQMEITDKCNFDCIMCNRLTRRNVHYKLNNDIRYPAFVKLIDEVKPFYVTLNGLGEPLLNKDIDKILLECRNRNITTSMPCNLSANKVLQDKIVKCPPNIITFSIHGASKEIFEAISVKSNYEECLAALQKFIEHADTNRTSIRVLCALQCLNLTEHKKMFVLLNKFNLLDNFCLVPVYDYGDEARGKTIPTETEKIHALRILDSDIQDCRDVKEISFYRRWQHVMQEIQHFDDNIDSNNKPCLIPWFSSYIAANGDVIPCCYLTSETHVMGNIMQEDFSAIWNGGQYKHFRKELRERRGQLAGCRNCSRNDVSRIRAYGFMYKKYTAWPQSD